MYQNGVSVFQADDMANNDWTLMRGLFPIGMLASTFCFHMIIWNIIQYI